MNNYYAIGMKNKGVDFNKDLQLDSDESKKVINYYAEGVKDGYFRIAGSDQYLSGPSQTNKLRCSSARLLEKDMSKKTPKAN